MSWVVMRGWRWLRLLQRAGRALGRQVQGAGEGPSTGGMEPSKATSITPSLPHSPAPALGTPRVVTKHPCPCGQWPW